MRSLKDKLGGMQIVEKEEKPTKKTKKVAKLGAKKRK